MRFLIVTGQSGAGKAGRPRRWRIWATTAWTTCPRSSLPVCGGMPGTTGRYDRVALVSDVRAGQNFDGLLTSLDALDAMGCKYSIVYVEAETEEIIKRYKETRRSHPLSKDGTPLATAVVKEKQLLSRVRARANFIIDTTSLSTARLRSELIRLFEDQPERAMVVNVLSFGFKYGIPADAD